MARTKPAPKTKSQLKEEKRESKRKKEEEKEEGRLKEEMVESISNKELRDELMKLGVTPGPITDCTRKLYQRRLVNLMKGLKNEEKNGSKRTRGMKTLSTMMEEDEEREGEEKESIKKTKERRRKVEREEKGEKPKRRKKNEESNEEEEEKGQREEVNKKIREHRSVVILGVKKSEREMGGRLRSRETIVIEDSEEEEEEKEEGGETPIYEENDEKDEENCLNWTLEEEMIMDEELEDDHPLNPSTPIIDGRLHVVLEVDSPEVDEEKERRRMKTMDVFRRIEESETSEDEIEMENEGETREMNGSDKEENNGEIPPSKRSSLLVDTPKSTGEGQKRLKWRESRGKESIARSQNIFKRNNELDGSGRKSTRGKSVPINRLNDSNEAVANTSGGGWAVCDETFVVKKGEINGRYEVPCIGSEYEKEEENNEEMSEERKEGRNRLIEMKYAKKKSTNEKSKMGRPTLTRNMVRSSFRSPSRSVLPSPIRLLNSPSRNTKSSIPSPHRRLVPPKPMPRSKVPSVSAASAAAGPAPVPAPRRFLPAAAVRQEGGVEKGRMSERKEVSPVSLFSTQPRVREDKEMIKSRFTPMDRKNADRLQEIRKSIQQKKKEGEPTRNLDLEGRNLVESSTHLAPFFY